jgi:hypothetical protein
MELEQIIRQAFAEVAPLAPDAIDPKDGAKEHILYEGKPWWEINPIALSPEEAPSLSESALIYLLPAYMTAALTRSWMNVKLLLDVLYTRDTPWEPIFGKDWWRQDFVRWDNLMKRLTSSQKHAVRLWLEAVLQRYPERIATTGESWRERIEQMLANYWNQF